jgi:hypothetical protein
VSRHARVGAAAVAILLLGLGVVRSERSFTNPMEGDPIPVGYWNVRDLRIAVEAHAGDAAGDASPSIVLVETGANASLDVRYEYTWQLVIRGLAPYTTARDATTGGAAPTGSGASKEWYLAHAGDLFTTWDEVFKSGLYSQGAKALLIGTDPTTGARVMYPLNVMSPDFDTGAAEIDFTARPLYPEEYTEEISSLNTFGLEPRTIPVDTAVRLVDVVLVVEPLDVTKLPD